MGPPQRRIQFPYAQGCADHAFLDLDARGWLPADGPRFLVRLCREAGLGRPASDAEARRRLERVTAELLVARGVPAALVVRPGIASDDTPDRLLAIALLSRASERVFLARRRPDLRREVLARRIRVGWEGVAA